MAATVSTTYRINGSRNFVAVIQIAGDAAGDITGTTVIDPASLTGTPSTFKIKKINWDANGCTGSLYWDATTPVLACALPQYGDEMDFYEDGAPLVNNAGAGKTGKLTINTSGVAPGSTMTITINGYHA